MRFFKTIATAATLGAALLLMPSAPATAASMGSAATALGLAAQSADPIVEVQRRGRGRGGFRGHRGGPRHGYYRGGRHRGGGGGAGIAAGLAAGALLGGIIASQAAPRGGVVVDDEVEYCMSRFKSYDPRSGTYLGYDGLRHPCP